MSGVDVVCEWSALAWLLRTGREVVGAEPEGD